MKTSLLGQKNTSHTRKFRLLFHLTLTAVSLIVCVWVQFPLTPILQAPRHIGHRPAGQFQADARTVVAMLRYALEPENGFGKDSSAFARISERDPRQAAERPCGMLAYSSNQTESNAVVSTNRAGRS